MMRWTGIIVPVLFFTRIAWSQERSYPQNYFRHPLDIPMQLVANFGEIRANHWHMGLDIRTMQRVNLPVFAAADGYVVRVSVEPGGFGQAIYIQHPNGFTTVYGHLNAFFPALAQYVKEQQYAQQSWRINLEFTPDQFPVTKGQQIALSGSTGASEGPHVHFEIRDSKSENCLNPLLFHFPIPDAVPPSISRLAMYDRNRSTYDQSPQLLALKRTGTEFTVGSGLIRTGSDKISFAVGAVDRFTGYANPNGIYQASISMDGNKVSEFILDDISYNDTRYINAQLDYPYKSRGGGSLQHISPLPGAREVAYHLYNEDGFVHLNDQQPHELLIEVRDANGNSSRIRFRVQYDASLAGHEALQATDPFLPNQVNIFERDEFEGYTTERTIYDTIGVRYEAKENEVAGAVSRQFIFLDASIPAHDSFTVRVKAGAELAAEDRGHIVIKNICGDKTFVAKAQWQNGWLSARFRQFGSFQAFIDKEPPTVNAPASNVSRATSLVFTPHDNFNSIRSFRAELDGQWLRFSNDKGRTWIYSFDEKFPRGQHELKLVIEDEAGNVMTKSCSVTR